jgi:steroid delta-isomerase-like uncharacterized protein
MNPADYIEKWFAAWNARDGGAAGALITETGSYEDPTTGIAVRSFDMATVVEAALKPFPDAKFEIISRIGDDKRVCVEWIWHGTNSVSFMPGVEPTGKTLHLRGVDVFEIADGAFTKVTRHFDRRTMAEQLGLQVLVEPRVQGRAVFGYSMSASSDSRNAPGIIALTWIRGRDDSEKDRIRFHSRKIIADFLAEPGFIGVVTGFAGDRGFTVTAWETEDALYRALDKQHAHAKQDFRTSDLSPGVWTSVWKPHHLNRVWTRCLTCGQPNDVTHDERQCAKCGAELPPRPSYWGGQPPANFIKPT